jgi:hypothetical protein
MKQLGPYRKIVITAAVVQTIIVVVAGYLLFKSSFSQKPDAVMATKPVIEQPKSPQQAQ